MMKPGPVLLTALLLVTGMFSCITKDKSNTYIADDVLPEIPLKKTDTALIPQPDNKEAALPKKVRSEFTETYIAPSICEGTRDDGYVIPPPPEEDSIRVQNDDSVAYFMCNIEEEAKYPGGTEAWHRFLNKNLIFPTDSNGIGIQGTVMVDFVIDEDGNVADVKAVNGTEPLTTEAIRVIKKSCKWTPAKLYSNGRHVKSHKRQPVIFRM